MTKTATATVVYFSATTLQSMAPLNKQPAKNPFFPLFLITDSPDRRYLSRITRPTKSVSDAQR